MTLTQTSDAVRKSRPAAGPPPRAPAQPPVAKRLARGLAFDRVGAVYVWLGIIVIFSLWAPETFPNEGTAKQILNSNAIVGLAALSITIPLAARVFDLSFAGVMTLTGVAVAHFIAKDGIPLVPAIALALAIGLAIGLINAVVVVVMRIDSFIGTLATGSLIAALITMITNETPITDAKLGGDFAKIGQTSVGGLTLGVFYFAVVALAIWYLLEHTATGRRLYATGFNPDASRLAGVHVDRLRFMSLIASGGLAGAAGVVLASTLASGSPTAGSPYLLPAFAAAFLGATQLKHGRFNAGGTIIAVLLLGTGVTGLGLANAPLWAGDMFVGVVLIAALAVTGMQRRTTVTSRGGGRLFGRRSRSSRPATDSAAAER
jgi:ribose transport system permease protein